MRIELRRARRDVAALALDRGAQIFVADGKWWPGLALARRDQLSNQLRRILLGRHAFLTRALRELLRRVRIKRDGDLSVIGH